ncbi:Pre-mRNA-splicing factor SPF27 [Chaetomium tenue]|uniref:Pre-mRNA-splicing factor SPF27 n=1 Tax=Chaetomium tenue TaxID=1854479 RepID=A0ACB7PNM8_9PEZI|nr:Pre-mRNA-splicing factor SPF27 [Chaetomium globosum]
MPVDFVHESLPYVDPDPTPAERAAAEALIAEERTQVPDDPHHLHLPPAPTPTAFLTPLLTAELTRLATTDPSTRSQSKLTALDFTRYEAPDPPSPATLNTLPTAHARAQFLQTTLSRAYASHSYIASRRTHLALLEAYGKNAWLVGNASLEGEVRAAEQELAIARREVDATTLRRRAAQDAVAGEMAALEEAWRSGVGRVLETEAAVEGLRREGLGLRRRLAGVGGEGV